MSSPSVDNLVDHRRALLGAIRTWHLLSAHVWVRLTAKLRQVFTLDPFPPRFMDAPDLPRTFSAGCDAFHEALSELDEFDPVPAEFPWLWCGGQLLTFTGPTPDLDRWLDSIKDIGPDAWQQAVVDPFMDCAAAASSQLQAFTERFERAKEQVIAASDNRVVARLQIEQALQRLRDEEQRRQEELSERRRQLSNLFTGVLNAMGPITPSEPAESWTQRLAERLGALVQEVRAQGWEDWLRGAAESTDEALIREFANLVLEGDPGHLAQAVATLAGSPKELQALGAWVRGLATTWPNVFDQGWLRWTVNKDLPCAPVQPPAARLLLQQPPPGGSSETDEKESPMTDDQDREFMELAIEQARKSVSESGRDSPKVGAVVVKEGKVVTTAFRGELGEGEHAEFTALERKLPDEVLAGATVYTTLEPCTTRNHPKVPCAERLHQRRVRRVVIGMLDPNQAICGKGERYLRDRGIVVDRFPHELIMQLEELNRAFTRAQSSGQDVAPAAKVSPAEDALLKQLRSLYQLTHDNVSPGIASGVDPLPKEWVEAELAKRGLTWRLDEYY
jgi:pyrimidine deaminase RibD-like protein